MNSLSDVYSFDPQCWANVFVILSLDVAAPFLSDMGLQLTVDDALRSGLRKIINERLAASPTDTDAESSIAKPVFRWLLSDYGKGFADELYAWGRETCLLNQQESSISLWAHVIRNGKINDDVPTPAKFVSALQRLLEQRRGPSVYRMKPASEWDKRLYERRDYDEFYSPMESVQAAINQRIFLGAWQEAMREPEGVDLEELYRWGIAEGQSLGAPVDRLGKPGDWEGAGLPAKRSN